MQARGGEPAIRFRWLRSDAVGLAEGLWRDVARYVATSNFKGQLHVRPRQQQRSSSCRLQCEELRGVNEAEGWAALSLKRRAVDLRPSSVQLGQDSPAHQSLPASHEPIHCPRMPYLRAVRSAHRVPASPYARATTSRARTGLMQSKATISTAPSTPT